MRYVNPNLGFTSFDNMLYALLVVFVTMTFETWTVIMQWVMHYTGELSFYFFFLLILIGAYCIPNLALAVINEKFLDAQTVQDEKEKREKKREEEAQKKKQTSLPEPLPTIGRSRPRGNRRRSSAKTGRKIPLKNLRIAPQKTR